LTGFYFSISIVPVISYSNADTQKKDIIKDNRNKCGVYKWRNNVTNKEYVGSSSNLVSRLYSYYSLNHLAKQSSSLVCKALLKYGHSMFSLEILEYCKPSEVIIREQYYIDFLKPEYNILSIAGSSYGRLRLEETKLKIKKARLGSTQLRETKDKIAASLLGRKHSAESLAKMKDRMLSEIHLAKLRDHLAKLNSLKGTKVKIIDTQTNEISEWDSIYKAAVSLGANQTTIGRYLKAKKLYKGRYAIVLTEE
jgi:group I intron endonuclease